MDGHHKVLRDANYEIGFIRELSGQHAKYHTRMHRVMDEVLL